MCAPFLIIPRNTQGLTAKVATANRKKKKYIIITVNCSNLEPLEM